MFQYLKTSGLIGEDNQLISPDNQIVNPKIKEAQAGNQVVNEEVKEQIDTTIRADYPDSKPEVLDNLIKDAQEGV